MIKIAHIATVDRSLHRLLLNQMCSIQEAGYEVVGISSPGDRVPILEKAGIRHIPVTMSRAISPLADLVALYKLYRIMRRERFTIVHTHTPKPGLLGQLAARLAGVPVVVNTLHGFYFHDHMPARQRQFLIAMEKIAALCSDVILSQNEEDIRTAIREKICPPERIKHLGNGIDLRRFDPARITDGERRAKRAELGLPEGAPVIGFVGRLAGKRKGVFDLLAAGQRVVQRLPEARLLIVGSADEGKADAVDPSIAAQYGIAQACLFCGQRPNEELPVLLSLMDVLVLPSLFEGIPRVVMEASAMGLPCVVTNVKGNREAVEQGRSGLLVPLGDVAALSQAILDVLTDPETARRLGAGGRQVALERFDERLVFDRVKAEYQRLLDLKGLVPVPIGQRHSGPVVQARSRVTHLPDPARSRGGTAQAAGSHTRSRHIDVQRGPGL